MGFDLDKMEGFVAFGKKWDSLPRNNLYILLNHSDCDGEISVEESKKLLEAMIEHKAKFQSFKGEVEHKGRKARIDENTIYKYERWIDGLEEAIEKEEEVEFY